jgi:hypothetical protein
MFKYCRLIATVPSNAGLQESCHWNLMNGEICGWNSRGRGSIEFSAKTGPVTTIQIR